MQQTRDTRADELMTRCRAADANQRDTTQGVEVALWITGMIDNNQFARFSQGLL
jgi:hypothetical protein